VDGGRLSDSAHGRRLHPEESPRIEAMSRGRGTKRLNENLAPLLRFLRRSVGRPWNAVHSEICAQISANSAVQKHVLDHVRQMVETNAVLIAGQPYEPIALGTRRDRYLPICSRRMRAFYVCPHTGLLQLGDCSPRKRKEATPCA
jgi:hypothetical protein